MTSSPNSIRGIFILPVIVAAICLAASCKKDDFKGIDFKVKYEYDGEIRSFEEKALSNYPDSHSLIVQMRNDTTFIYSPRHIWWNDHFFYGYLNIIDKDNSYLPNKKTEYELKPGVIYPDDANSRKAFTESVIITYPTPRKAIEVIEGHCSIEPVIKRDIADNYPEDDLIGVKICFNANWREVESGEEHEIKNGEALYSSSIITTDHREMAN